MLHPNFAYYAQLVSNAPPVPEWFDDVEMPQAKPHPRWENEEDSHAARRPINYDEIERWMAAYRMERMFQWPIYEKLMQQAARFFPDMPR